MSRSDRGRSEKALSRTADRYVPEGSDCAIVPVNRPNKQERSWAEVGEERAQTKENIVGSDTSPTPSGKRVSQRLDGVRRTANESRQEKFTALLHHLSVDLLRDSFYALRRKAAPGMDGVRWREYETGLEGRLVDLHAPPSKSSTRPAARSEDRSSSRAGFIVERTGRSPRGESASGRTTDGSVGWA